MRAALDKAVDIFNLVAHLALIGAILVALVWWGLSA